MSVDDSWSRFNPTLSITILDPIKRNKFKANVPKYFSKWVPFDSLFYWVSIKVTKGISKSLSLCQHSNLFLRSKPLQIWDAVVRNGHIKRITDPDIQSSVLEIMGTNVSTNYIVCPAESNQTLGIKLPFLVMIVKNVKKYFTFEVQVLDDKNVRRRFRASNYQSTTRVKPFICTMPMRLDEGWNQIQFNLSDFTRRAYGTNYIETLRVQIHANCRIRRIYFSDRLYSEDELPPEFKLFLPVAAKISKLSEEDVCHDDKGKNATDDYRNSNAVATAENMIVS